MGNFQKYIQFYPPTDKYDYHFRKSKDNFDVFNCNEESKYPFLQNIIPMLSDFFPVVQNFSNSQNLIPMNLSQLPICVVPSRLNVS